LYATYGPQHWWPGSSPFEIAVGAILTQNTSWVNVERAIANLKEHECLSPQAIHCMSVKKLGDLIRSSGFYNIKAMRLKEFVTFLMEQYDGEIERMKRIKRGPLREELLGIRGIGPETGDSIMLYALGKAVFVVDGYTRRILSRHGLIKGDTSYEAIQTLFESNLKRNVNHYNEYHALLVKLAKERCRARDPVCDGCPLASCWGLAT
jgi:endonuclease-3 related protein